MLIKIPLVAYTTDTINVQFKNKEIELQAKADMKNMILSDWLDKYYPNYADDVEAYYCDSFEIDDEVLKYELAEDNWVKDSKTMETTKINLNAAIESKIQKVIEEKSNCI